MQFRNSKRLLFPAALATLELAMLIGCAHRPIKEIAPLTEFAPPRVARELGFAGCQVTDPMRKFQTLDYADQLGDPKLQDSPEWNKAIAMMQPGDQLRYVYCKSGDNFFGLFRGTSLLFKFGGMLFD